MKAFLIFTLLILFNHLLNINCFDDLDDVDIIVSLNDGRSKIEAYKSKKNDLTLENIKLINNSYNIRKLKWYSYGHPIIIKDMKDNNKNNEKFFSIRKNGFHTIVQLLTEYQKKLIQKSVFEKYGIIIELYQIEKIPLSSFVCELTVTMESESSDDSVSIVKGSVKELIKDPLRVDFKANEHELGFLENIYAENDNDFEFKCTYKSTNNSIEKKFVVKTDRPDTVKFF